MMQLIGISGSLRKGSFNTALLRAAGQVLQPDVSLLVASIRDIPLYDGDVEAASGIPPAVRELKDRIAAADGLVLSTPEYNNSLPGVLKNAVDWLSRPSADIPRVFRGRPVAIMGASAGGFGTVLSQSAWLPVLRTLGTQPWFGSKLLVSRAAAQFDAHGELTSEELRKQLRDYLAGFVGFIRETSR